MRRKNYILTILTILLTMGAENAWAGVTDVNNFSNTKAYTIKNKKKSYYFYAPATKDNDADAYLLKGTSNSANRTTDKRYMFLFVTNGDSYNYKGEYSHKGTSTNIYGTYKESFDETNERRWMYSVAEKKFVSTIHRWDDYRQLQLVDGPEYDIRLEKADKNSSTYTILCIHDPEAKWSKTELYGYLSNSDFHGIAGGFELAGVCNTYDQDKQDLANGKSPYRTKCGWRFWCEVEGDNLNVSGKGIWNYSGNNGSDDTNVEIEELSTVDAADIKSALLKLPLISFSGPNYYTDRLYTIKAKNGKYFYADTNKQILSVSYNTDERDAAGYRFAFIEKNGRYYLYSPAREMWVVINKETFDYFREVKNVNKTRLALSKNPDMTATVVLERSTEDYLYPVVIRFADNMICRADWNGHEDGVYNDNNGRDAINGGKGYAESEPNMMQITGVDEYWGGYNDARKQLDTPLTALSQTSNFKCYTIGGDASHGGFFAKSGTRFSSTGNKSGDDVTTKLLPRASFDTRQQWAFIYFENNYYLWNVAESKFAKYVDDNPGVVPADENNDLYIEAINNARPNPIVLLKGIESTSSNYPLMLALNNGGNIFQINAGWDAAINWNYTDDSGNYVQIFEAGDFDPTEALEKLMTANGFFRNVYAIETAAPTANQSTETDEYKSQMVNYGRWYVAEDGYLTSTQRNWESDQQITHKETNDDEGRRQLFAFAKSGADNSIYLYNVGAGGFVKKDGTFFNVSSGDDKTIPVGNFRLEPSTSDDRAYPWVGYLHGGDFSVNINNGWEHGIITWVPYEQGDLNNAANCIRLVKAGPLGNYGLSESTLTNYVANYVAPRWTVTFEDAKSGISTEVYNRRGVATKKGIISPMLPPEFEDNGWVSYAYDPTTADNATRRVAVTATWDNTKAPFTLSYEDNVNYHWLRLAQYQNPTYQADGHVRLDEDFTLRHAFPEDRLADKTTPTQWAFFGNPYTGLIIRNRAAGSGKQLVSGDPEQRSNGTVNNDGADGGNTEATVEAASGQYTTAWIPKRSTDIEGQKGFYLVNQNGVALNYRATEGLYFWTAGKNVGSTFEASPVPATMNEGGESYWAEELQSFYDGASDTEYLHLKTAAKSHLTAGSSNASWTNYDTWRAALANPDNLVMPAEKGFYRVKNQSGKYAAYYSSNTIQGTPVTVPADKKETNLSTIMEGTKTKDGTTGRTYLELRSEATPVTVGGVTKFNVYPYSSGLAVVTEDGNKFRYLYEDGSQNIGIREDKTGRTGNFQWGLEAATEVKLTMNLAYTPCDHGGMYATAYLPFNAILPSDVGACILELDEANKNYEVKEGVDYIVLRPTRIAKDKKLPAGTPVMLISNDNTAAKKDITLTLSTEDFPAIDTENSLFEGTYFPYLSDGETCLVMNQGLMDVYGRKVIGFYNLRAGSYLAANRTYIPWEVINDLLGDDTDGPNAVKEIVIDWSLTDNGDEETDGVDDIENAEEAEGTAAVYDLSGRQMANGKWQKVNGKLPKGLYIINGRKVAVK